MCLFCIQHNKSHAMSTDANCKQPKSQWDCFERPKYRIRAVTNRKVMEWISNWVIVWLPWLLPMSQNRPRLHRMWIKLNPDRWKGFCLIHALNCFLFEGKLLLLSSHHETETSDSFFMKGSHSKRSCTSVTCIPRQRCVSWFVYMETLRKIIKKQSWQ